MNDFDELRNDFVSLKPLSVKGAKHLLIRLSRDEYRSLRTLCFQLGISIQSFCRAAITGQKALFNRGLRARRKPDSRASLNEEEGSRPEVVDDESVE